MGTRSTTPETTDIFVSEALSSSVATHYHEVLLVSAVLVPATRVGKKGATLLGWSGHIKADGRNTRQVEVAWLLFYYDTLLDYDSRYQLPIQRPRLQAPTMFPLSHRPSVSAIIRSRSIEVSDSRRPSRLRGTELRLSSERCTARGLRSRSCWAAWAVSLSAWALLLQDAILPQLETNAFPLICNPRPVRLSFQLPIGLRLEEVGQHMMLPAS